MHTKRKRDDKQCFYFDFGGELRAVQLSSKKHSLQATDFVTFTANRVNKFPLDKCCSSLFVKVMFWIHSDVFSYCFFFSLQKQDVQPGCHTQPKITPKN